MTMYPKVDILYFTLFPWDHSYSSVSLSFSREFTKNNRVIYVNHPFTVKDFFFQYNHPNIQRRKKNLWLGRTTFDQEKVIPQNFAAVQPPNTLPINFLPPGLGYQALKKWNDRIVLKAIQKAIQTYELKNFIFLNCFNPFYVGYLPKGMGQRLNIYQCIDDMTQEDYTAKHAHRLEEEVIRSSDIALVTSRKLYQLKSPLNKEMHILHNAVDWNIFKHATETQYEAPPELVGMSGKVIGFTGNLNAYRVNYALLKKIALRYPNDNLVLVGPLNSDDYKDHQLDQLPNVVLTGGKNIKELPRYLQYFDCLIIPFHHNKLTESVYPLKINEYLSSGKPVVSTNFSVDIESFGPYIYLAESDDQFLECIDRALLEDDPEMQKKRIEVAKMNTWEARVKRFWEIVEPKL